MLTTIDFHIELVKYLTVTDIFYLSQANKALANIYHNRTIWSYLLTRDFNKESSAPETEYLGQLLKVFAQLHRKSNRQAFVRQLKRVGENVSHTYTMTENLRQTFRTHSKYPDYDDGTIIENATEEYFVTEGLPFSALGINDDNEAIWKGNQIGVDFMTYLEQLYNGSMFIALIEDIIGMDRYNEYKMLKDINV